MTFASRMPGSPKGWADRHSSCLGWAGMADPDASTSNSPVGRLLPCRPWTQRIEPRRPSRASLPERAVGPRRERATARMRSVGEQADQRDPGGLDRPFHPVSGSNGRGTGCLWLRRRVHRPNHPLGRGTRRVPTELTHRASRAHRPRCEFDATAARACRALHWPRGRCRDGRTAGRPAQRHRGRRGADPWPSGPHAHAALADRGAAGRRGARVSASVGRASRTDLGATADPAATEARIFVKAEHLQVTGSFKSRGAVNRLLQMTPEERQRGIITMSAGNHAGAVAYAAAAAGIPVTVVMPAGASRAKVDAARGYGATVELYGVDTGETFQRMQQLLAERGAVFVPPFDDPDVIAGQGTTGLEIVTDLPAVTVVVAGVGGGGLLSGVAAAVKQARPDVRVYGVEPRRQRCHDPGARGRWPGPRPAEVHRRRPERAIRGGMDPRPVSVDTWTRCCSSTRRPSRRGMRFALERMKQLLEPGGAAALGAVLAGWCRCGTGTSCVSSHRAATSTSIGCRSSSGRRLSRSRARGGARHRCPRGARARGRPCARSPTPARRDRGSPPGAGSERG